MDGHLSKANMDITDYLCYTMFLMAMHALTVLWLLARQSPMRAVPGQVLLSAEGRAEPGRGAAAPGAGPAVPGTQSRPWAGAHQGPARQLLPRASDVSNAARLRLSASHCQHFEKECRSGNRPHTEE